MENAYARSVIEVLDAFGVDPTKGLTDLQVAENSRIYGENVLPQEESNPFWKLILKQFDDLLVRILIAAAIISFVLALINGETGLSAFLEPSVIFMILAANAAVGVITETNAEKAIEELRAYQADVATVLRNGCFSILSATELVPGDIVEVGVGCKVPADMRLIEMLSNHLRVDQAILTGESSSVAKDLESSSATNAVYQDKTNILFSEEKRPKTDHDPKSLDTQSLIVVGSMTCSGSMAMFSYKKCGGCRSQAKEKVYFEDCHKLCHNHDDCWEIHEK